MPSGLPDAITRREILAGNPRYARIDLAELGRRYLTAEWLSDAIDCFERAEDRAGLDEVKRAAIERDVFALARLARVEGGGVTPEEWRRAGEAAGDQGRDRAAALAFERAGDADKAAAAGERAAALQARLERPKRGRGGLEIA